MRHTALLLVWSLCATSLAWADGMLDPDFGVGGRVTTSFGPSALDWGVALAVLPDGRAVAAGTSYPNGAGSNSMAVARYLSSGALDTSFDGDGLALVDFVVLTGESRVSAKAALLQPDGKLVLVGQLGSMPVRGYALARLNPDGSLDSAFGTGGRVFTPLTGAVGAGSAAALQPDGRILVLGNTGTVRDEAAALARYNADGSLDGSFGTAGQVTIPQLAAFRARALALQPDGRILIAGTVAVQPAFDMGVIRLLPGGALDTSFDGDGIVISDFGGATAYSVTALADGRIVVSGAAGLSSQRRSALARYLSSGALDMTFGTGGLATGSLDADAYALVEQADGKLLVAGFAISTTDWDFILERFNADGSDDTSFGVGGSLRTDFGGGFDSAHALAVAGPDRVLAVGQTNSFVLLEQDFALARYIATTPVEALSFTIE